ncbi:MAG TPA: glycosyltransferase, partial [Stackebrandtia sp.]|uniref:glycosyltransferase n=1 Tax=Stackebrandtia sp. TaxID=2023065 RepID=UPI002D60AFD8
MTGDSPTAMAASTTRPLVCRNDYSSILVPANGSWTPTLTVSILIPAHGHQDKLDLTLAALAAQTYPDQLTQVIVVDDNTNPPLALPDIRPTNTTLLRPAPDGWGSAHAVNTAAQHADGTVLMRLDSDMITYHHHVESQMRYHHQLDYAAVLGHKLFTDYQPGQHTAQHVHATVANHQTHTLFDRAAADPHWIESIIERTDGLRNEDHTSWRVFVGATGSTHRDLFAAAGGYDGEMILGGDTEFGYRLGQAGAVFIPDHDSSSWHLGRTQIQSRREDAKRFRRPFQANRMPALKYRDSANRHQWVVPLVDVVMDVGGARLEQVREAIDPLLGGHNQDTRVHLVADWPDPHERHATLDDPYTDLRLINETYRGEPRVHFHTAAPERDFHVPYRLTLPIGAHTTRAGAEPLITVLDERRVGLLTVAADDGAVARLERQGAFARARHLDPGQPDALIDAIAGTHHIA